MSVNSFECPICGKRTVHDEVTYAEHEAIQNRGSYIGDYKIPTGVENAINNVVNFCGMPNIFKQISSFNGFWKCRECGRSYARKKNGEIDWDRN